MIEKKIIRPSKFISAHEAEPLLCAPTPDDMKQKGYPPNANFFFWMSGAHKDGPGDRYFLRFTEDECRRCAYLFEQAADRMAGVIVSQSDDGYEVQKCQSSPRP